MNTTKCPSCGATRVRRPGFVTTTNTETRPLSDAERERADREQELLEHNEHVAEEARDEARAFGGWGGGW